MQADLLPSRLAASRQTVNAIETSNYDPSLPLAFKIARVFETSIEELFDPEDGLQEWPAAPGKELHCATRGCASWSAARLVGPTRRRGLILRCPLPPPVIYFGRFRETAL